MRRTLDGQRSSRCNPHHGDRAGVIGHVKPFAVRAFQHARRIVGHCDGADDVLGTRAQHRDAIVADQVGALAVAAERQAGQNAAELAELRVLVILLVRVSTTSTTAPNSGQQLAT